MPLGIPSKSGDEPATIVATTVGGTDGFAIVGRMSNTATLALPLPTNRKFPSAVASRPFGPDKGFKLLAREAQHWPPSNPPKCMFGLKNPGKRKFPVLHP